VRGFGSKRQQQHQTAYLYLPPLHFYSAITNNLLVVASLLTSPVSTEPKCYIDTGICTVTLQEDNFRSNLLYAPLGIIFTLTWIILAYEFFALAHVYLNPLIILLLGGFPIYKGTELITDKFIFTDSKVAYGPCPSCNAENRVYFGDILGVEGFKDTANVKCSNCKIQFNVQRNSLRASTLPK